MHTTAEPPYFLRFGFVGRDECLTHRRSLRPLALLDRAGELTLKLTADCKAFLATQPYTLEERPDESPTTRAFVVTAVHEVPLRPRIIAGEIAHHLRASLDSLAQALSGVNDRHMALSALEKAL